MRRRNEVVQAKYNRRALEAVIMVQNVNADVKQMLSGSWISNNVYLFLNVMYRNLVGWNKKIISWSV